MSGYVKIVFKTESTVFYLFIYFLFFIIYYLFIYFFAFAMVAACKSYLAWNMENVLPHVSFIYRFIVSAVFIMSAIDRIANDSDILSYENIL